MVRPWRVSLRLAFASFALYLVTSPIVVQELATWQDDDNIGRGYAPHVISQRASLGRAMIPEVAVGIVSDHWSIPRDRIELVEIPLPRIYARQLSIRTRRRMTPVEFARALFGGIEFLGDGESSSGR